MAREQKVQVFSLGLPKKGTRPDKRRYKVKWAVDGRHKTRSFKNRAQAERMRSALTQAVRDGLRFDIETGLPARWERSSETWWSWSTTWLGLKWPGLAGNSRRSVAESLVMVTPHLVRSGAADAPPGLLRWLWNVGFVPSIDPPKACRELVWLERWSMPLADITAGTLEAALVASTTRLDGQRTSVDVTKRRLAGVKSALRAAVNRELIDSNPMDRIIWTMPKKSSTVNVALLPSVADVLEIVTELAADEAYRHYAGFFALLGLAGLRPSEAARLRTSDVDLPSAGWGEALLHGALTSPGKLYTTDGLMSEEKSLKQRGDHEVRVVPLPPVLVTWLRWHVIEFEKSGSDRLFTNKLGNDLTKDNWGKPWRDLRARRWPDGHRLDKTRPYDLRHTAATMMLRAGVSPSEVALRLGHSVDMLMKIYAGVFEDERRRSNRLIDTELDESTCDESGPDGSRQP